jgi:hypothetical protein
MKKLPIFTLASAFFMTAMAVLAPAAHAQGQSGTTLSASKTATGAYEHRQVYDWSLTKSASPSSLAFDGNQTQDVTYTLTATRSLTSDTTVAKVTGQICVTNGGAVTTENLTLVDQVLYKTGGGAFQPLAGATQTLFPAQLAPGASSCTPYEIIFTPVPGAQYKNNVRVTITNHSGHSGEAFGPGPSADFSLPASPTLVEIDETASLADVLTCPTGFTCSYDPNVSSWNLLTGSQVITYVVHVTRTTATCGQSFTLDNTATLTEGDTQQTRSDSESIGLTTEECLPPPPTGGACTHTIGYWKTHPTVTATFLPLWLGTAGGGDSIQVLSANQAVAILKMNGQASNGINKLYAQLLGTKLSLASGASDASVAAAITAADTFLATHASNEWSSLTTAEKNQVLAWATLFDNFNNGIIGPAHCD